MDAVHDTARGHSGDTAEATCRKLLKAELHAHLAGCVRMSTLAELSPAHAPQAHLLSASRSLSDCFAIFAVAHAAISTTAAVARVARECVQDAQEDGIGYMEVRSTPRVLDDTGQLIASMHGRHTASILLPAQAWLQEEEDGATSGGPSLPPAPPVPALTIGGCPLYTHAIPTHRGEMLWAVQHWDEPLSVYVSTLASVLCAERSGGCGPVVRLLLSINRTMGMHEARAVVALAMVWAQVRWRGASGSTHRLVVGMDVSGDPSKGSLAALYPLLDRARCAGLRVTIHAGEVPSKEEVEGVLAWRPDRLGHMCVLPEGMLEQLQCTPAPLAIPIELCPTSNAFTLGLGTGTAAVEGEACAGGKHRLCKHPTLLPLLLAGYPLAVCTDDWGVFSTTLSAELAHVAAAGGWDLRDMGAGQGARMLAQLVMAGFKHAFLQDEPVVRDALLLAAAARIREVLGVGVG